MNKKRAVKKDALDMIVSGRGGQGVLTAGKIISAVFVKMGYDVKMSVDRGIAQRGGLITCHIRAGKKIFSPLISKGKADILMLMDSRGVNGFSGYLKDQGLIILLGQRAADSGYKNLLKISYDKVVGDLGGVMTVNIFMLGVLSNYSGCKNEYWLDSIREAGFLSGMTDLNLAAFKLGRGKPDIYGKLNT